LLAQSPVRDFCETLDRGQVKASAFTRCLYKDLQHHAGTGQATLYVVSALGWSILLASTLLINHFELFGLQQVFNYWRGVRFNPPAFKTPALYRYVRHPLYLGFILAFWAAPRMTQGHLLFALATTAYTFVGIFFEERDLIAHFGDEYRRYRQRVPMILPFLRRRAAPLGRNESRART
jgi:methanethiol S-methyltransferase